jgi:hypothetical protein
MKSLAICFKSAKIIMYEKLEKDSLLFFSRRKK